MREMSMLLVHYEGGFTVNGNWHDLCLFAERGMKVFVGKRPYRFERGVQGQDQIMQVHIGDFMSKVKTC